jgi:hypothetical protein
LFRKELADGRSKEGEGVPGAEKSSVGTDSAVSEQENKDCVRLACSRRNRGFMTHLVSRARQNMAMHALETQGTENSEVTKDYAPIEKTTGAENSVLYLGNSCSGR